MLWLLRAFEVTVRDETGAVIHAREPRVARAHAASIFGSARVGIYVERRPVDWTLDVSRVVRRGGI